MSSVLVPFPPPAHNASPATPPRGEAIPTSASPGSHHVRAEDAPAWEELAGRFRPIFARIAEGALAREQQRILAHEPVAWLRDAGFGSVRLPRVHGGLGATLPQLFRLLIELGEADSNVAHLLRGHFAFLEGRLNDPDANASAPWFERVAAGAILGYAMAERTEHTGGSARLLREGGACFVDGTKYYSTGTIYADWIIVSVLDGEERLSVGVPANAPGVTRLDDWDGFGQRLTGSGTTRFNRVKVAPEQIVRRYGLADLTQSYQKAFLQLVLLATSAGIARAVLRDGIAFVRPRTRAFGIPGKSSPKDDPLVQRVIGRVSSLAFSAESLVLAIAQDLESLYQRATRGEAAEPDYVAAEIRAYQAQQIVLPQVLEAATLVFEVGGASATSESLRLDRHWRNARTAASHNPAIHREAAVGDWLLNGTLPDRAWREALQKAATLPPTDSASAPSSSSVLNS